MDLTRDNSNDAHTALICFDNWRAFSAISALDSDMAILNKTVLLRPKLIESGTTQAPPPKNT